MHPNLLSYDPVQISAIFVKKNVYIPYNLLYRSHFTRRSTFLNYKFIYAYAIRPKSSLRFVNQLSLLGSLFFWVLAFLAYVQYTHVTDSLDRNRSRAVILRKFCRVLKIVNFFILQNKFRTFIKCIRRIKKIEQFYYDNERVFFLSRITLCVISKLFISKDSSFQMLV